MTELNAPNASKVSVRRQIIVRSSMFVSYAIAILVMGLIRNGTLPGLSFSLSDKVLHGVVFGGFAVLTYRLSSLLLPTRRSVWHASAGVIIATNYGILLEIFQFFTGYRSAELLDVLADLAGAVVFVAIAVTCRWERPQRLFLS